MHTNATFEIIPDIMSIEGTIQTFTNKDQISYAKKILRFFFQDINVNTLPDYLKTQIEIVIRSVLAHFPLEQQEVVLKETKTKRRYKTRNKDTKIENDITKNKGKSKTRNKNKKQIKYVVPIFSEAENNFLDMNSIKSELDSNDQGLVHQLPEPQNEQHHHHEYIRDNFDNQPHHHEDLARQLSHHEDLAIKLSPHPEDLANQLPNLQEEGELILPHF